MNSTDREDKNTGRPFPQVIVSDENRPPVATDGSGEMDRQLGRTSFGLKLMHAGILSAAILVFLGFAVTLYRAVGADGVVRLKNLDGLGPFFLLLAFGLIICWILTFAGQWNCISISKSTGAKGAAIASFRTLLVAILISSFGIVMWVMGNQEISPILAIAGDILAVISLSMFFIFMQRLAQFLGRDELEQSAVRLQYIFASLVIGLVGFVAIVFALTTTDNSSALGVFGIIFAIVFLLSGISFLAIFIDLLRSFITAIDRA